MTAPTEETYTKGKKYTHKPKTMSLEPSKEEGSLARGTIISSKPRLRQFGPELPYRNAEGILVCPPRYAHGFKPNNSTFKG